MKGMALLIMERVKKVVAAGLILLIGLLSLTACGRSRKEQRTRGPLAVKKVTYLVYYGGLPDVDMYIFTSDLKVKKYSIKPEGNKNYDYLAGELPSEDQYEITEFEISDGDWSSIVSILTRVNFMELDEDVSTKEMIDDGSSYYIKVETNASVHISGGYVAGYDDNPESRRFADAREYIENAIKNN